MITEPSNSVEVLHNEDYDRAFNLQNLNHAGMILLGDRPRETLNGAWIFALDPHDTGLRQHWYRDAHLPPQARVAPWDYDLQGGAEITVPGCWNLARPEWWHYEGSAWYGRRFAYAARRPGERVVLRIGAANYDTKVFLNGRFLGNHYGGSTPFFAELTGLLTGANQLFLCVNNERRRDRVPMGHTDWFNYGGVFREIEILRLPPVYIKDLFVRLVPRSDGRRIAVSIALSDAQDGAARLDVPGLVVEQTVPIRQGRGELILEAAPELWSPAAPRLYAVQAHYGPDRLGEQVGFREIATAGQRILLNGEEIRLRGIGVHEDDRDLGRVSDDDDLRRRFAHAKALGANFLRLAHYPHHERAALLADAAGLLLWQEIPVYWAIAFDQATTLRDADNQLRELILRDRNRASVIVWGIGNENADSDARLDFMSRLAATARTLDDTRLVSAACLVNPATRRIEDRLAAHLDLVGINEYYGWYEPDMADLAAIGAHYTLAKPLVITETGADAVAGYHDEDEAWFSEERQAAVYRDQTATIARIDAIRGFCPWILYDFRSQRRQNRYQQGWNLKGLIAADKATRKQAFAVLANFYRTLW